MPLALCANTQTRFHGAHASAEPMVLLPNCTGGPTGRDGVPAWLVDVLLAHPEFYYVVLLRETGGSLYRHLKDAQFHATHTDDMPSIRARWCVVGPQPVSDAGGVPTWVAKALDNDLSIKSILVGETDQGGLYQRLT